jgi:Protein of unknown function (DUF732)
MAEITKSRACIDQTKGMLMLIYGIDDAYLNAMAAHNIFSVGGPVDLVQIGRQVCNALGPSVSPPMLTKNVERESISGGWLS